MRLTPIFLLLIIASATTYSAVATDTNSLIELQQAKAAMPIDLDLAEQHIEKALVKAPQDEEGIYQFNAWYQIGRTALFSEQQLEKGIQALKYYITQAPKSANLPDKPWAHFRLAQLYKLNDNKLMMQQHLDHASNNNDKELQREIRRIRR